MRPLVIPASAALFAVVSMCLRLALPLGLRPTEPPALTLPDLDGYSAEWLTDVSRERRSLPPDTVVLKRRYTDADGERFVATVVIGGLTRRSIHQPEVCLPLQNFVLTNFRPATVGGIDWTRISLAHTSSPYCGFAYTFFNQAGARTASHYMRVFRDAIDRGILGRIDRWVMLTVTASTDDDARMNAFLSLMKDLVIPAGDQAPAPLQRNTAGQGPCAPACGV